MATRKRVPKPTPRTKKKTRRPKKASPTAKANRYATPAWERVYLLSLELDALAKDLGLHDQKHDPEGFDLVDAARELARLAGNHHPTLNSDGRTPAQTKDDWIAAGGVGADLGNMAAEDAHAKVAQGVRAVAYEVCYLVCNHLF
jgi:hypothetical protein